jgi:hypothetical protein
MYKIAMFLGVMSALTAPASHGQSLIDHLAAQDFELGGIRFYGVTAFLGYSTSAFPLTTSGSGVSPLALPGAATLGAEVNYGASASAGWHYRHDRTNITVLYSASYSGNSAYSSLNAFGDHLSISASRKLTPKLQVSLSVSGSDTTFAQFLFQPTTSLTQASSSSSLDDLAEPGSAAPALESPVAVTLLGNRILSYSGQLSAQYTVSPRLHLHFGSVSAAGEHLAGNNAALKSYLEPSSFGVNAGASFSFSYSVTPRTTVGLTAGANWVQNSLQNSVQSSVQSSTQRDYLTSASVSLRRTMGEHWFLSGHAGGSENLVQSQTYGTPQSHTIIGGGQIGFRTGPTTLSASFNRNAYDNYGFAVGVVSVYGASWFFRPTGTRWMFSATFAEQQMKDSFLDLTGWSASGSMMRSIGNHLMATTSYSYMSSSGTYLGTPASFGVSSVRIMFSYRPQGAGMMTHAPSMGNSPVN